MLGVRTAEPDLAPFSVTQLASSPVWNASETAARNITRARFFYILAWALPGA